MPHKSQQEDMNKSINSFVNEGLPKETDPLMEKERRLNQTGQVAPGRPDLSPDRIPRKVKREAVPKEIIPSFM